MNNEMRKAWFDIIYTPIFTIRYFYPETVVRSLSGLTDSIDRGTRIVNNFRYAYSGWMDGV